MKCGECLYWKRFPDEEIILIRNKGSVPDLGNCVISPPQLYSHENIAISKQWPVTCPNDCGISKGAK